MLFKWNKKSSIFSGTRALLFVVLLIALGLCSFGCGPSLKATMDVPVVRVTSSKLQNDHQITNTFLYVDEFVDNRQNKTLVKDSRREVTASGDVAPVVVDALRQALGDRGFSFSESAPVIISGEVREWLATISGSLPTKVSAEAAIFVEILDPANKRIYSGTYKGFASMEAASVSEEDVKRTLASSMEEAVTQVAMDKPLVALLSAY